MRSHGVQPLEQDKPDPNDSDDLNQGSDNLGIPADTDIPERDEEEDEEDDLPPAMPPAV
jgi:hypothetical protein